MMKIITALKYDKDDNGNNDEDDDEEDSEGQMNDVREKDRMLGGRTCCVYK